MLGRQLVQIGISVVFLGQNLCHIQLTHWVDSIGEVFKLDPLLLSFHNVVGQSSHNLLTGRKGHEDIEDWIAYSDKSALAKELLGISVERWRGFRSTSHPFSPANAPISSHFSRKGSRSSLFHHSGLRVKLLLKFVLNIVGKGIKGRTKGDF